MAVEVCLRVEAYLEQCRARGWAFESQQAAGLGLAASTVHRVLRGTQKPGGQFIGAVLRAFPDADFAQLFDVVELSQSSTRG